MAHRGQLSCLSQPVAYHSHTLTSSSHSSMNKLAQPQRTSSQDTTADGIRKRVCKACDRCRLKKSKCDGSNPCTRCKTDNAICVFGERKKSHDKVYPKGYVEMLEQQQGQLVSGLVELYHRLRKADAWTGPAVEEHDGKPYTHHILAALDLLEMRDGTAMEFEEDTEKLQAKLIADGAGMTQHNRRGSCSSESEHSQHSHARSHSHGTPLSTVGPLFKEEYKISAASEPASTPAPSPATRSQRHSFQQPAQPSPLQQSSPLGGGEANIFQPEWQQYPPANEHEAKYAMQAVRPGFGIHGPSLQHPMGVNGMPNSFQQWDAQGPGFDMLAEPFANYPDPAANTFQNARYNGVDMPGVQYNEMEFDFGNFVTVHT